MKIWLLIILLEVVYVKTIQVAPAKLKISIYYESLCEDSVNFITQQLYPAYPEIKSSVLIDFVPYGKAKQIKLNGEWQFECQHGPEECWGNTVQACGLAQNKGQDADVEFINCVMSQPNPDKEDAVDACAPKLDVTADSLIDCAGDSLGNHIHANYGFQTHGLRPAFIPTIVFNDYFDQSLQDASLTNFLGTVRSLLVENPVIITNPCPWYPTGNVFNFNCCCC